MKKTKIIMSVSAMAAIVCSAGALAACNGNTAPAISQSAAKQIAYSTLGATAADVQYTSIDADTYKGTGTYEVEFYLNGLKYEIKVNAATGAVEKVEINNQTVAVDALPVSPLSDKAQYIGTDAALAAALSDAGLAASDVVLKENKLDFDDGKYLYEIEFSSATNKYEYEIDALSGGIHKKDVDDVTLKVPTPSQNGAVYITLDEAKSAAVAAVNGASVESVTFTKAVFDTEDGLHVYEIEFTFGDSRYEIEINAVSGAVYTIEVDNKIVVEPSNADYIGVDAAIEVALSHAGVVASSATITSKKFDIDDRHRPVYEIEFVDGTYEYEINAQNGAVVDFDKERIDND